MNMTPEHFMARVLGRLGTSSGVLPAQLPAAFPGELMPVHPSEYQRRDIQDSSGQEDPQPILPLGCC